MSSIVLASSIGPEYIKNTAMPEWKTIRINEVEYREEGDNSY